jgi:hypothetical protein
MKAVTYYRTRPSEPEASAFAFRLQLDAVRETVAQAGLVVIAEFIEREDDTAEAPAYVDAVRTAVALKEDRNVLDVALLTASSAGIGRGKPFHVPAVDGLDGLWSYDLQQALVPTPPVVALPPGGPDGALCIYSESRPDQRDTLVYLCNTSVQPLNDVAVVVDTVAMRSYSISRPADPWAEPIYSSSLHWDAVQPGTCILLDSWHDSAWDMVSRYRLSYIVGSGPRHMTSFTDGNFREWPRIDWLPIWLPLKPVVDDEPYE